MAKVESAPSTKWWKSWSETLRMRWPGSSPLHVIPAVCIWCCCVRSASGRSARGGGKGHTDGRTKARHMFSTHTTPRPRARTFPCSSACNRKWGSTSMTSPACARREEWMEVEPVSRRRRAHAQTTHPHHQPWIGFTLNARVAWIRRQTSADESRQKCPCISSLPPSLLQHALHGRSAWPVGGQRGSARFVVQACVTVKPPPPPPPRPTANPIAHLWGGWAG